LNQKLIPNQLISFFISTKGINPMKSERGQALILIALGMAALLALTALAIDGGMAFAERRSSQNAVDNAALAAAYKLIETRDETEAIAAAQIITNSNGFDEDNSIFDIQFVNVPPTVCNGQGFDITVTLGTSTETSFARTIGVDSVESTVRAVTRACFTRNEPLFWGNAVVGLAPDGNSFETTSNQASWTLEGGGIFANHTAYNQNSSVTFIQQGQGCGIGLVAGNGFAGNAFTSDQFNCKNVTPSLKISYPEDAAALIPEPPACSGTAQNYQSDGQGSNVSDYYREQPGHEGQGSKVALKGSGKMYFDPGVYCITNSPGSTSVEIYGTDVLFWVQNPNTFEMKFAGGGGFFTSGRVSGPERFNGYMLIIPMSANACNNYSNGKPAINLRGNADGGIVGTILAPSACIDLRGNSSASAIKSQIIAYKVSSNGGGDIFVSYNSDENRTEPKPSSIELLE
jgi:hypothetical protein